MLVIAIIWCAVVAGTGLGKLPAAVWVTGLLLAVNVGVTLWTFIRRKRVVVLLNLMQVVLFGLIHYQIFSALGPRHYTSDRPPNFLSWAQFTGAHVLRAVDILDGLEEYGINLQDVKHASTLSGRLLVALHLVVGLFLLSVVARGVIRAIKRWVAASGKEARDAIRKKKRAEQFGETLKRARSVALVTCLLLCGVCGWVQGWSRRDWALWPVDNALRTVDIGDVMQIFHYRLHGVEMGAWTIALALSFRLLVGLYLAGWVNHLVVVSLGARAMRTLEDLIEDLGHENPLRRKIAAGSLGQLGVEATSAVPTLAERLADNDADVRETAARALKAISPDWPNQTSAAVPVLTERLMDKDWLVRQAAAEALGWIGPPAASAVSALTECLTDQIKYVRRDAAGALGRIGPPAASAGPALAERLSDEDWDVRESATDALARLGPPAVPGLIARLADKARSVREGAAKALGWIGAPAGSAVPALADRLADQDPSVRMAAAEALGRIGPAAVPTVSALIGQLADSATYVRRAAAEALGRIGPPAAPAIPALSERLTDEDSYVRKSAEEALQLIAPNSK